MFGKQRTERITSIRGGCERWTCHGSIAENAETMTTLTSSYGNINRVITESKFPAFLLLFLP